MKDIEKLNNQNLENIAGGSKDLEDYLKALKDKKDEALVSYGTGQQLDLDSDVYKEADGNLYVIKREKGKAKLQ